MSGGMRRGGIPGPESRTGLVRPAMTEAEFERRQQPQAQAAAAAEAVEPAEASAPVEPEFSPRAAAPRGRAPRPKATKPRRVQRMFALEEDLDKKLWLYAIHVGSAIRFEVVNDLLRPLVCLDGPLRLPRPLFPQVSPIPPPTAKPPPDVSFPRRAKQRPLGVPAEVT